MSRRTTSCVTASVIHPTGFLWADSSRPIVWWSQMCFQDHRYPDIQELNVDSVSFSIPFLCASWMCSYVSDTTTYHSKGILPSSLPKPFILRHGDAEIWTLTTTYVRIHETPFSVAWIRMNSKDDTLGPFVSFGGV